METSKTEIRSPVINSIYMPNILMVSLFSKKALPKVNGGYSAGLDERPAHLVRRYGELYSQMRLETLDALDKLPQLVNSDELKIKLLFSVMVVSVSISHSVL